MSTKDEYERELKRYVFRGVDIWSRAKAKQEQRYKEHYYQERNLNDIVEKIESQVGLLKNKRVLEIGSGTGGLSVALALRGAELFGVEPEESGVNASQLRAKRYSNIRAAFAVGFGESLNYKNDYFDIVLILQVIEHVKEPKKVVSEICRVLKPGGACYLEAPNYLWPVERHYKIFYPPLLPKKLAKIYLKLRGKNPLEIDNINYVTPKKVKRYFNDAGFKSVENILYNDVKERLNNPNKMSYSKLLKRLLIYLYKYNVLYKSVLSIFNVFLKVGFYPSLKFKATK